MEKLTLRQLEVFGTAAKLLSFTKTARTLEMSKPAVTKQIQNLEGIMGFKLFNQIGKKIYLTPEAKNSLPFVFNVLDAADSFNQYVQSSDPNKRQFISVGMVHTFVNIMFPLLRTFGNKYNIELDVSILSREDQAKKLEDHRADVIITGQNIKPKVPTLFKQLFQANFMLCSAATDPLAKSSMITAEQLSTYPIVLLRDDDRNPDIFKKCKKLKIEFKKVYYLESYAAICDAVIAGLGIGILPENIIRPEIKQNKLTVLPYDKINFTRNVHMITHKQDPSPAVKQMIKFFSAEAKAYGD